MDNKYALALSCLMAFWLSSHAIRPHIFTPLFAVALVGLIGNLNKLKLMRFIGVVLLFLVWANLHGGFIVGLIVLGGIVIGCLFSYFLLKLKENQAKYFFLLLVFSFLATLINPYGFDVYSSIVQGVHNQSFDWMNMSLYPRSVSIPTAIVLLLSVLFLAWYMTNTINNRMWDSLPWLFAGMATYATLITARRLEWMLFIPVMLLFQNYSNICQDFMAVYPRFLQPLLRERMVIFRNAIFYMVFLGFFAPFVHARASYTERSWYEGFSPEFQEYFSKNHVTGNIFCPLTWSGKITLITKGNLKIYIDGRLLLYPGNFFNDYLDILYHRGLTASQIKAYNIEYLLLPLEFVDRFFASSAPIHWKPVKVADNTVLFKRDKK